MRKCNKCSVELVVGENIAISQMKLSNYVCKGCMKVYQQKYYKTNHRKLKNRVKQWSKSKQGVYGIFSGETCLYVGESSRLLHRIANHKSGIKKPKGRQKELYIRISRHSDIYFKVLEETKNHLEQEKVWIDYMNPLYNTYNE